MNKEPEYANPYVEYGDRVREQVAGLPLQSRWAFDLACLEREVVIYQKVSRLRGAEHLLDVPGIVADLWAWLLEGKPVSPSHLDTIEAAVPYPKGPDFRGFRFDVLTSLGSAVGRILGSRAYDDLLGVTAEANINLIRGFLCVAYDLEERGGEANLQVLNHRLLRREVERQQEDLKLLRAAPRYTQALGELMRERSTGYDLFDGEWFPESKLPQQPPSNGS